MTHVIASVRRRGDSGETDLRLPSDVPSDVLAGLIGQALEWPLGAGQVHKIQRVEQLGAPVPLAGAQTLAQAGVADGAILTVGETGAGRPNESVLPSDCAHAQLFFERPPRLRPAPAGGEIELVAPPAAPAKPRIAWPSVLVPALFGGASLAASLALRGNGNGLMNFMMTGFMALSSAMALWNYQNEKRAHARALRERAAAYTAYLAQ